MRSILPDARGVHSFVRVFFGGYERRRTDDDDHVPRAAVPEVAQSLPIPYSSQSGIEARISWSLVLL
jgi:hypothetical protein